MSDDRSTPKQNFFASPFNKSRVQNAILEATRYYQQQQRTGRGGPKSPLIPLLDLLSLKNNTGDDLGLGRGLKVGDYLLDEADLDAAWLDGDSAEEAVYDAFGITIYGVEDAKIELAQMSGVAFAWVNKVSEHHPYAYLAPDGGFTMFPTSYFPPRFFTPGYFGGGDPATPVLLSGWFGSAEILAWCDPDADDGEQWAIVRLGPRTYPTYYGKADADTAKGSRGTVSVWMGDHGSETDTTVNIDNVLARSTAVGSGDEVYVSWIGGPRRGDHKGGPEMVPLCG